MHKKRSTAEQFTHDLSLITGDIEKALRAFYIQKFIDEAAMKDEALFQVLNRRALLWNGQMNSLQTTLFITLGRIFDHSAHSIQKVMDEALAHPEFFLRDALYARRLGNGPKPNWLDAFVAAAHVPNVIDLRKHLDIEMFDEFLCLPQPRESIGII